MVPLAARAGSRQVGRRKCLIASVGVAGPARCFSAPCTVATTPIFTKRPVGSASRQEIDQRRRVARRLPLGARQRARCEALFLVPWEGQSFKWHAHRADVVNRKDIPQDAQGLMIDWPDAATWSFPSRMDGRLRLKWTFKNRSPDAVRRVARQVGATHLITSDATLRLPIVYRNDYYAIYGIDEAKP